MSGTLKDLAIKQGLNLALRKAKPPETPKKKKLNLLMKMAQTQEIKPEKILVPEKTESAPVIQRKNTRLVDADFPFDESQLAAINGLASEQFGVLTGAAGTGKTTCTKALIDKMMDSCKSVDMNLYNKDKHAEGEGQKLVTSICLCAFTGIAMQQIRKNFPEDWHSNIMTIHTMLAFAPVWYDVPDLENGGVKKKMEFLPRYDSSNKLPWDIIVIDEAGMLGLDLWRQIWDACLPTTRIIMIGDINQLPPVHGNSIFGFASINWPSFELTHIHRQKGENNPIVENAWRVLQGKLPIEMPKFKMYKVDGLPGNAAKQFRAALIKLKAAGIYDPVRDTGITPINGNPGSSGQQLGQEPMNEFLAIQFNPDGKRYLIDAGRERRGFAPGDKVMVTSNDHKRGLTNGMTGVIESIKVNGNYTGDHSAVGAVENLQAKIAEHKIDFDPHKAFEEMTQEEAVKEAMAQKRGHASHVVEVKFAHGTYAFESFGEVASLQLAYVITGHKSQGSEYPVVIIMVHDSHKAMMYREWLYTVITRSSDSVVLLYTDMALSGAVRKQKIVGNNLKQKAEKFIQLMKSPLRKPPELPAPRKVDKQ